MIKQTVLWALAGAFCVMSVRAHGAETSLDERVDVILDDIETHCADANSYPARVTPLPLPAEVAKLSRDEFVEEMVDWNPAYVYALATGLKEREADPELFEQLFVLLSGKNELSRRGAMVGIKYYMEAEYQRLQQTMNYSKARAEIQERFARDIPRIAIGLKDPSARVRVVTLETLSFFEMDQLDGVKDLVVPTLTDPDEYVAEASSRLVSILQQVESKQRVAVIDKAIRENLRPRGRGSIVGIVQQLSAAEQEELVPTLMWHMGRKETRDSMFAGAGRGAALAVLAKLGHGEEAMRILSGFPDAPVNRFGTHILVPFVEQVAKTTSPVVPRKDIVRHLNYMKMHLKGDAHERDRLRIDGAIKTLSESI